MQKKCPVELVIACALGELKGKLFERAKKHLHGCFECRDLFVDTKMSVSGSNIENKED